MDVRASSDPNTPVIMHDSTVGRTTNVFDPRIVPDGQAAPSGALLDRMKQNVVGAAGANYPSGMDQTTKQELESNFDARNAFSPYGNISATPTVQPVAGTTYGRNPLVKDLSVETLTNLRLLKHADPAPKPSIKHDGTFGPTPAKGTVSTETVQTVQSLLEYAAQNQTKSAIVFDVIERESLTAIAKILANDTHTFINGRKAKDIAVIKYRGKLEPNIGNLMNELKESARSTQYPDGFYPNLIGIVAKYFDKPGVFDSVKYVDDWIQLRKDRPELPLISLDTVVTSPDEGASLDLVAKEKSNGIAIGSFQDVPSYRGGDIYSKDLVDRGLYFLSDGSCCRSTDSTGDPKGTSDKRNDYSWMISGNTSNSVPSGMITSDDPMPIIKTLEKLSLRKKALNAYKTNPVGEYDGQYNQLYNSASEKTLGVGEEIVSGSRADQQNSNYRKNNIWAFEWIQSDTYRIKLLNKEYGKNDLYLTNENAQVKAYTQNGTVSQYWRVRHDPANDFLSIESADPSYPGSLAFEGDSWVESKKAVVTSSVWSTQKWQIKPLDAAQDLPLNPQTGVKLLNQYTGNLMVGVSESRLETKYTGDSFTFPRNSDGSYQIASKEWGKAYVLDCSESNGQPLYAGGGACNNWLIIREPDDQNQKINFFNLTTGKIMDFGNRTAEGQDIFQWESSKTPNQRFLLLHDSKS